MFFDWCLKLFSNSFISEIFSKLGKYEGVLDIYKWTHSYIGVWNNGVKRTEVSTVKESIVKMVWVEED